MLTAADPTKPAGGIDDRIQEFAASSHALSTRQLHTVVARLATRGFSIKSAT